MYNITWLYNLVSTKIVKPKVCNTYSCSVPELEKSLWVHFTGINKCEWVLVLSSVHVCVCVCVCMCVCVCVRARYECKLSLPQEGPTWNHCEWQSDPCSYGSEQPLVSWLCNKTVSLRPGGDGMILWWWSHAYKETKKKEQTVLVITTRHSRGNKAGG